VVLIEINGHDLRRDPLEVRKATLASVLAKAGPGLRLNEHIEHSRFTAAAAGFFILSQSGERPLR
jgi:hypothetical protein